MTTLYDLFAVHATQRPDATAFIFGSQHITYAEMDAEIERVTRGLHARGIGHGDRVLLLAGNEPSVLSVYLAVGRLGAVYVPVSAGFKAREIDFVLRNAEPKLAIVAAAHVDDFVHWAGDAVPDLVVFGADDPGGRFSSFGELGVGAAPVPAEALAAVDPEDGVLLCYTSGTTSTPKPVLHSHRSEVYSATTYAGVWNLGPSDRGVVCLPLAWIYGLSSTTAALLVSGSTVVLLERFHPVEVLDVIEARRATAMWGTMSMYTKMLEVVKQRGATDLSSLRVALNGGEPCPPPLVAEFESRTGVSLQGSYATSEVRPVVVVAPGDAHPPKGTVGKLVPGAQIRLEGADGLDVGVGAVGHALLRGPGTMSGYYREPELVAERVTDDGWLRTGDLMRVDDEGYYFVIGRRGEMIIRSGVNIAPAEVESALVAHPHIADAAVVGVPDERSGEAIRAVLVAERGTAPTADEVRSALAEQLSAYKLPQEIIFVDELPRTDRGKLDRLALTKLGLT